MISGQGCMLRELFTHLVTHFFAYSSNKMSYVTAH